MARDYQMLSEVTKARVYNPTDRKTSWSLEELYDTDFPEPNWIIPEIIPEGLIVLAGRPKVGKSWLALQIACAVSTGGKIFNKDITQGSVLYLALEDYPRRLKDRSLKMGIPKGPIQFETSWRPLHKGGLDDLMTKITVGDYRLVVIDTLTRALPGVNHNDEQPIGVIMEQLHDMAMGKSMTILPVDHTRKNNGAYPDPIDDVMGHTSKSKPLDAVLALYTEQGKAGATLKGKGKDTEDIDISLIFDKTSFSWQSQGSSNDVRLTKVRRDILDALRVTGKTNAGKIASMTDIGRTNIYQYLNEMVNLGMVKRECIDTLVFYEAVE